MVLTEQEAQEYNNGKLSLKTFKKVMHCVDFEKYLFRYCKIINDFRPSETERETVFNIFGYTITVFSCLGETIKINYKK